MAPPSVRVCQNTTSAWCTMLTCRERCTSSPSPEWQPAAWHTSSGSPTVRHTWTPYRVWRSAGRPVGDGIAAPATLVVGVELERLAHVVAERAGRQQVAVDRQLREAALHLVAHCQCEARNPADVVELGAALHAWRVGHAGTADLVDGVERAVRQRVRPGARHLVAQVGVTDLGELGQARGHGLQEGGVVCGTHRDTACACSTFCRSSRSLTATMPRYSKRGLAPVTSMIL